MSPFQSILTDWTQESTIPLHSFAVCSDVEVGKKRIIYVQAKRWESTVGRPEVQGFVGALAGRQAQKGVFITTSSFTADAIQFARDLSQKVILISAPSPRAAAISPTGI